MLYILMLYNLNLHIDERHLCVKDVCLRPGDIIGGRLYPMCVIRL